ncbi:MAG: DUF1501 domain-containing protein [Pirellulales bacterium]
MHHCQISSGLSRSKAGSDIAHGVTDEFGYYGVDKQVHINDLHATMLHLRGLIMNG